MAGFSKIKINDLAFFGGGRLFDTPVSTSSLAKPEFEKFIEYSSLFYEKKQYTNGGPLVELLEKRLAEFHRVEHVVAVSSGFWGLVLAIKCLARNGGVNVLMPSLTYRRLADVVAWTGLVPKFCDVDPDTLSISVSHVENSIDDATALIIAVHPIVNVCDAVTLEKIALENEVPLLFDSVESVYESVAGVKTGGFGIAECYSLHASKLVNGFEGGYITTNDSDLCRKLRAMRGFGFENRDRVDYFGINAKLNEMHAALALANLDELENLVCENKMKYEKYKKLLINHEFLELIEFNEKEQTSYKNILVKVKKSSRITRDLMVSIMNAEGVLARSYYSPPLHQKKMSYPHIIQDLPVTDELSKQFMLLPCGAKTSILSIECIIDLMNFIFKNEGELCEMSQK